jgi:lipoprotein-releasing system ATP-binding protein
MSDASAVTALSPSPATNVVPLLHASAVSKTFAIGHRTIDVLRGVEMTVNRGDMVAIVGRSGSGKSTLLHLLGALDEPSSGEIHYDGRPLADLSDEALAVFRNRTIGFVFQFHHLLPELTALENVLMPALIARQRRTEVHGRALALLERVGLGERTEHHPGELSGGEQQRVALARALVMGPRIVLADEPTGNLDGRTASEIHDLMEELNRETGTAFVIVSHNRELAARMDRVLSMQDGAVTALEAAA